MLELGVAPQVKLYPEFKERWLTALRSGDYGQTTGYLHEVRGSRPGWCCLGVACDILADREGVERRTWHDVEAFNGEDTMPPRAISSWMFEPARGMSSYVAEAAIGTVFTALAKANDSGSTFEEIAEWIEEHL